MSLGTHTRIQDGQRIIWEVEDLWRLAEGIPTEEADPKSLIDLEVDGWFKGKVPTAGMVLSNMKRVLAADLNYPVLLDQDGTIMDGAHRVCKAILLEVPRVKFVRFCKTPRPTRIERVSLQN